MLERGAAGQPLQPGLGAGYRPQGRDRAVSAALRAYAALATSADRGAVRDVDRLP